MTEPEALEIFVKLEGTTSFTGPKDNDGKSASLTLPTLITIACGLSRFQANPWQGKKCTTILNVPGQALDFEDEFVEAVGFDTSTELSKWLEDQIAASTSSGFRIDTYRANGHHLEWLEGKNLPE